MSSSAPMRVVLNRWFWLNYAVTLGLTCWIPLLSMTPVIIQSAPDTRQTAENTAELAVAWNAPAPAGASGENATVQRGPTTRIPLYTCYWRVLHGDLRYFLWPVALHLALCFAISFWVWWTVLRKKESGSERGGDAASTS